MKRNCTNRCKEYGLFCRICQTFFYFCSFLGSKTVTCRSPQAAATSSALPSLPLSALTAFTRNTQTRASRQATLRSILLSTSLSRFCLDRVKCLTCLSPASPHPPSLACPILILLLLVTPRPDSGHDCHTAQSILAAPPDLYLCPIPQPIHLLSPRLFKSHCFHQVQSLIPYHSSLRESLR